MKITIIYGNQRKESTYHCVKFVKEKLTQLGQVHFSEFFLPRDLPHFCLGCFNCFLKGEEHCPHFEKVYPIVTEIINSDGIILASPVYGFNITGAMKSLVDHLCYLWMPHRPNEKMFQKIAMIISTTAGGGTGNTIKGMKIPLNFMGFKRIHSFGIAVAAASWQNVDFRKKEKIEKVLNRKTVLFYKHLKDRNDLSHRLYTRINFFIMKKVILKYYDDNLDKAYWKEKGWFTKNSPFKYLGEQNHKL